MEKFVSGGKKLSVEIGDHFAPTLSYGGVRKLIRKKDVKVNGARVSSDVPTEVGDVIEVYYDKPAFEPKIIYSDENLLLCHKPVNITSEDFYGRIKEIYPEAAFLHRLDRNTDGLIAFALNSAAEAEMLNGFKQRTFEKFYLAEVYGAFVKKEGVLTAYLMKDAKNAKVEIFSEPHKNADKIVTKYKTLKEYDGRSLLEVGLVTGKTHQIRAHLAHEGHFVIGDGKYGKESVNRIYHEKKQRLTAYKIIFHFGAESILGYLDGATFTTEYGRLD
ncbi:MAG: RluA family pseudouridine synthase [Clostridia bacterium]|nr:RluA family pseudouridine synthase [Clostridia bacterium]